MGTLWTRTHVCNGMWSDLFWCVHTNTPRPILSTWRTAAALAHGSPCLTIAWKCTYMGTLRSKTQFCYVMRSDISLLPHRDSASLHPSPSSILHHPPLPANFRDLKGYSQTQTETVYAMKADFVSHVRADAASPAAAKRASQAASTLLA